MAVEKTPLSSTAASAIASSVFTRDNANAAGTFAKEQAEEVKRLASEGDFSIRLFAMFGGLAMVVSSVLGFVGRVLTFHWLNAVISVYTFILGIIMVMLEGKRIPFSGRLESGLYKYALFLKFVWGRGIVYFIGGTLEISSGGILELFVGSFVCFVGLAFVVVGRRSAKKLALLKTSQFSESTLRAEFASAANSGDYVSMSQFKTLVENLNIDFNRRELEAAFMQVEKADRDRLTYIEFKNWWDETDHEMV